MIELKNNSLVFTFPEVHPEAKLTIEFQRTLRIPDDGKDYPLPPGLGRFPLKHVDDYAETVPKIWIDHGGVMLPMYQSEALWLNFNSNDIPGRETSYPFAIKVASGKINAVTGDNWINWLQQKPQDYMVSTEQPWLDGFCVEKGFIRQFVAMPLGSGYSAEEQISGEATYGGLQIIVYPMKRGVFEKRFPKIERVLSYERNFNMIQENIIPCMDMALAPGGRMKQEIYEDPFNINDWEMSHKSRCFAHLTNSLMWRTITSEEPPTTPYTASEYSKHGLPWFEYYSDDSTALEGSGKLKKVKTVAEVGKQKKENPLPENESVDPQHIVSLKKGLEKNQVREGEFA
jgi:hypothetical protein